MTNEEILKLAIKVGFSFDEDDETWLCFEEELVKFAHTIHKNGYDEGYYQCSFDTQLVMSNVVPMPE